MATEITPAAEAVHNASDNAPRNPWAWTIAGFALVAALAWFTLYLESHVPEWVSWSWVGSVEFPVYAIILGLIGSALISSLGIRERVAGAFQTEFFIKTGLVLLGASINLKIIVSAAGPAIAQAIIVVTSVFFFTWWIAGKFGLDKQLRALLATALSICGVSAAIAAAGAVRARKEQLVYTATLVILFALPSIFILPWLAGELGLSDAVAGAWIGGNIDTTAAVAAAGAIVGDDALAIAAVVKATQNVLLGVVAVLLTLYFALKVEKRANATQGTGRALWQRFPKFVLGFILASVIGTLYVNALSSGDANLIREVVNPLRTLFLTLAFVSIGLEFRITNIRREGWRPVAVFGIATVANITVALLAASVLFAGFEI